MSEPTIVDSAFRVLIESGDVEAVITYMNRRETPAIHAAIIQAREALPVIKKSRKNSAQGWKFRSIDDVQNVMRAALTKAGIALYPEYTLLEMQPIGKGFMVVVSGVYRMVAQSDGSQFVATFLGQAADYGDKAVSKAKAMAFKYFAFQTFQIPVEENVLDDADKDVIPVDTQSLRDKYWSKK